MSSIDDRIVRMEFDNGQFESGVAQTNASLQSLQENLKMDGATSGLNEIQQTAQGLDLGNIDSNVQRIASAFSGLGVIAINVLSRITQEAIGAGASLISKVLDPLIEGGNQRALAIEQAKFQFRGLGLDITSTMNAAREAVLGTAYGLSDAAAAAGQLGASNITVGHGLEAALRGIAGVAAQTGSSFGDIARIFEGVAGNTRVYGNDLLSLASRGVNAAAILAKHFGVTEEAVRKMVTEGKVSFKDFSEAMNNAFGDNASKANETFAGALANMRAALSRIGGDIFTPLNEAQRKTFLSMRTAIDNIHVAIQPVIDLVGKLANVLSARSVSFIDSLDFGPLTKSMPAVAYTLQRIFDLISMIGRILARSFQQIFPPMTEGQILNIAAGLSRFADTLVLTWQQTDNLRKTFAGAFALMSIGYQVVSRLAKVLFELFGLATNDGNGILAFTGSIGDWLIKVDAALKKGTALNKFFAGLKSVLSAPVSLLKAFAAIIADIFGSIGDLIGSSNLDEFANKFENRFGGLIKLGRFLQDVFEGLAKIVKTLAGILSPFLAAIADQVQKTVDGISSGLDQLSFTEKLQALNTAIFGGFFLIITGFLGGIEGAMRGIGVAFVGRFNLIFGQLQVNLKALELNVNAQTILTIAAAVALLAASAVALSLVDPPRLASAMAAITAAMAELVGAFAIIQQIPLGKNIFAPVIIANALITLAGAILILSIAMKIMSTIDTAGIMKSLVSITVLLGELTLVTRLMASRGPGLFIAAAAILVLSISLTVLAGAMAIFAAMSWESIAKGLTAITILLGELVAVTYLLKTGPLKGPGLVVTAAALLILAVSLNAMASAVAILGAIPFENLVRGMSAFTLILTEMVLVSKLMASRGPGLLITAAAILILSVAMNAMAGAVAILGAMSWENMIKGLLGFAAVLGILIVAMRLMGSPTMLLGAIAMVIVSGALVVLAGALKVLGTMSWDDIGRGLVVLAGALAILAGAMALMGIPLVLLGSLGLIVAAGALFIIAPALKLLGSMSWDDIGRGLTVLAGALAILAVGGIALGPAIPGMLALGGAIFLIGAGALAAGIGMALFAAGLVSIAALGPAAGAMIGATVAAFAAELPLLAEKGGEAIGIFADQITKAGPAIMGAMVALIGAVIGALLSSIPGIVAAAVLLISELVKALIVLIPQLVDAGLQIIGGILEGIANNIGKITEQGWNVIINFLDAITKKLPDIIKAGGDLILAYINGMGDYIKKNSQKFVTAGSKLFRAIVDGVSQAIEKGGSDLRWAGERIGTALLKGAQNALGINSPSKEFFTVGTQVIAGAVNAVYAGMKYVAAAGAAVGTTAVNAVQKSISGIAAAVSSNVDIQPTIRPVLDLDGVRKDAASISGILGSPGMSLDISKANVEAANASYEENLRVATDADGVPTGEPGDTFIQNNYSPKALSSGEIYRQTKSQLADAKKGE